MISSLLDAVYLLRKNAIAIFILTILSYLSLHLAYPDQNLHETAQENRFIGYGMPSDLLILVTLFLGWCLLFSILNRVVNRYYRSFIVSAKASNDSNASSVLLDRRFSIVLVALIILICWLPYYLSWFPGGFFSDTLVLIRSIERGIWTNRFGFLYEAIWWALISISSWFGHGLFVASALMSIIQLLLLALVLAHSVLWLRRWGCVRKTICVIALAVYGLFPAFPLFAISLWRDAFFTAALFVFSLKYIEQFFAPRVYVADIVKMCILMLIVGFMRGNGVYVILGCVVVLLVVKRRRLRYWKTCLVPYSLALCVMLVIQGPVYSVIGASFPIEENFGALLQQVGAVLSQNGNVPEVQLEYFSSILPLEEWKAQYRPLIVDPLKWSSYFNAAIISENPMRFLEHYIVLGVMNPVVYAKAFLLNNSGFWNPWVGFSSNVGCYQWAMWAGAPVEQFDIIQELTGKSLRGILEPKAYITGGAFAWVMLIGASLSSSSTGRRKAALAFSPLLLLWLTLIIAAPLAISMRYYFLGVFMAPTCILLPFILKSRCSKSSGSAPNVGAST